MYFMSDTAPITPRTDATNCGIGGYLFQMVDGVNQPIAVVSKSLTSAQLRWSVIQKQSVGLHHLPFGISIHLPHNLTHQYVGL